jgi:putative toxin-antitoxin system antitoxin component (TIGR02293 family)
MPSVLATRPSAARAIERIDRGLPWREAAALAEALDLPLERTAALLDIPVATLYRRRRSRRFSRQESDRLRFARLWWLARDVFGNESGARRC